MFKTSTDDRLVVRLQKCGRGRTGHGWKSLKRTRPTVPKHRHVPKRQREIGLQNVSTDGCSGLRAEKDENRSESAKKPNFCFSYPPSTPDGLSPGEIQQIFRFSTDRYICSLCGVPDKARGSVEDGATGSQNRSGNRSKKAIFFSHVPTPSRGFSRGARTRRVPTATSRVPTTSKA